MFPGQAFLLVLAAFKKLGGWPYHTFIEDIESSAAVIEQEQVYYAHNAIFYDEQPENMRDSMRQRLRWVKGLYQVFVLYVGRLIKGMFTGKKKLSEAVFSF